MRLGFRGLGFRVRVQIVSIVAPLFRILKVAQKKGTAMGDCR